MESKKYTGGSPVYPVGHHPRDRKTPLPFIMYSGLPEARACRLFLGTVIVQTALFHFHSASAARWSRLGRLRLGVGAASRRGRRRNLLIFFCLARTVLC